MKNIADFINCYNRFQMESISSDPTLRKESFSDFVRFTGVTSSFYDSCIYSPCINREEKDLVALIEEQISYFRALKKDVMWKLYDFNKPQTLEKLLVEKGFFSHRQCSLMFVPTNLEVPRYSREVKIIQSKDPQDFEKMSRLAEKIHGENFETFFKSLETEYKSANNRIDIFYAELNTTPASNAWVRHYGEVSFFFGGSTLQEFRGRGIYSALVQKRIEASLARGSKFVVVECNKLSEKVLRSVGFQKAGEMRDYVCKSA